jgi:hypothetical protein
MIDNHTLFPSKQGDGKACVFAYETIDAVALVPKNQWPILKVALGQAVSNHHKWGYYAGVTPQLLK